MTAPTPPQSSLADACRKAILESENFLSAAGRSVQLGWDHAGAMLSDPQLAAHDAALRMQITELHAALAGLEREMIRRAVTIAPGWNATGDDV